MGFVQMVTVPVYRETSIRLKRYLQILVGNITLIYNTYTFRILVVIMGIVKISDELHEEIRKASGTMVRSINSQAEFWIKIGMLAETHPNMTYIEILREQLRLAAVELNEVSNG
ncbi:ParD-like family protein [Methylomonas methanica]|nr:ParD-like family protein [Methylomonas methanica]